MPPPKFVSEKDVLVGSGMEAWGKLEIERQSGAVIDRLSLVDHCADVAAVFRELCTLPAIRRNLEREAGRPLTETHLDRLAVFSFLHDLGKCNSGFQAKAIPSAKDVAGHVREVAALFFDEDVRVRACEVLRLEEMADWLANPETDLPRLLLAAVSHHGQPAFTFDLDGAIQIDRHARYWQKNGDYDPFVALAHLTQMARSAFPEAFQGRSEPMAWTRPLEHRFAGLVMLADWLGSHREAFFPFQHRGNRISWARAQARTALAAVGLDVQRARRHISAGLPTFAEVFNLEATPRPLQAELAHADLPLLLIAESDTGSGKTEAALLHFLALFAAGEVDALYFALPTRVAARELYGRVHSAMRRVFAEHCPPVLLAVPAYARVDGDPPSCLPAAGELWHEAEQAKRERAWSAERPKRFLAAPIAVGTIDQVLLSAIQVPHAHLRAACLDRALLVVDEVHSSDVYMRYLSRRVIARHQAAGGRTLLLSATLGSAARVEYLFPHTRPPEPVPFEHAAEQPYPALSAPGIEPRHLPDPACRIKRVHIQALPALAAPETLVPALRTAVTGGARVLVVLNTVARAMALARLADEDPVLAPCLFSVNGQRCPHHGRFARPDREVLDSEVSHRMGKRSSAKAVLLIGTQTLEQSLDIDADWLITDLCPMDVLLQRIGRLHRHDRGPRPDAVCSILLPTEADFSTFLKSNGEMGRGGLAGLGFVYEDLRILQLTRNWAADEPDIEMPRDNRRLVESATHPERLSALNSTKWRAHTAWLMGNAIAMGMAADNALIPDKSFGEFLFPGKLGPRLTTRLGLNDRIISLGGAYISPFGNSLEEISFPAHLAPGLDAEQAHRVSPEGCILLVHVGGFVFCYSRFGLERLDESVA